MTVTIPFSLQQETMGRFTLATILCHQRKAILIVSIAISLSKEIKVYSWISTCPLLVIQTEKMQQQLILVDIVANYYCINIICILCTLHACMWI